MRPDQYIATTDTSGRFNRRCISQWRKKYSKPAKLPLISRKPFIAAWNAPLDLCAMKYNITTNLDHLFHIHGSPRANWTGQNVTIFYANRLGYYPYYTLQGAAVHGGLPQNCSLDLHLFKAYQDINHFIPAEDFRGLAVIDWEFWRPQWSRNWYRKDIYRQKSKELTEKAYINVTAAQVEELAQRRFEKSARLFMQRTIQLGTQLRPNGHWGFYLYPDCHNYNLHEQNYTGFCPLLERLAAVAGEQHVINLHFSQHRIQEALHVTSVHVCFLQKDLIHTIGESAALGAAGFVIWGDLNLTSSRVGDNCTKVKSFLSHRLGQYIINVTRAAEVCSDFLCQGNGRCVRRDPHAPHYLHLSADSYHIQASGDEDFTKFYSSVCCYFLWSFQLSSADAVCSAVILACTWLTSRKYDQFMSSMTFTPEQSTRQLQT
uniref:Hyaluronidase n=1 Tax=Monopterus albus TaxID=43700 RepID=A0A3Q3JLP4_MONAL